MDKEEEFGTVQVPSENTKMGAPPSVKEARVQEDVEVGQEAADNARLEKIFKYAYMPILYHYLPLSNHYSRSTLSSSCPILIILLGRLTAESSLLSGSSTSCAPASAAMSA